MYLQTIKARHSQTGTHIYCKLHDNPTENGEHLNVAIGHLQDLADVSGHDVHLNISAPSFQLIEGISSSNGKKEVTDLAGDTHIITHELLIKPREENRSYTLNSNKVGRIVPSDVLTAALPKIKIKSKTPSLQEMGQKERLKRALRRRIQKS